MTTVNIRARFDPSNELERMLVSASTDPDKRQDFVRELLRSAVFAITDGAADIPSGVLNAGDTIRLVSVTLPDLGKAVPIFTASQRVAQVYGEGTPWVSLNSRQLFEIVRPSRIVLNPGLPFGIMWSPDDVEAMLGNLRARTLDRPEQVLLGVPRQEPEDLMFRLRGAFQSVAEVSAAWLAIAKWPDRNETAWFLDVRTTLPPNAIQSIYSRAIQDADLGGMPIDMTVRAADRPPGIGLSVVNR